MDPPSVRLSRTLLWLQLLWLPLAFLRCIHEDVQSTFRVLAPPPGRVPFRPQASGSKRRQARDAGLWLPIRITSWVTHESPDLTQVEQERLEAAVAEAVDTVSGVLSVNRIPDRLLLSRDISKFCRFVWRNSSAANYNRCARANEIYHTETCLNVIIPDAHLTGCAIYPHPDSPNVIVLKPEGAGLPDTDFVVYVHPQTTDKCRTEPSVLAYAVHCQTGRDGRPLAGVVVICRDHLMGRSYSHTSVVQTVIHELFHMLGFSKELFSSWRDCSYSPQMGCWLRGRVTNIDENGQVRIYTESVLQALQTHLGSSDPVLGGPLENQDSGPSAVSSHWEARVLQGSIMAAALGDPELVRIDPITLAALQDTGWYRVNHSAAQSLEWGEGQGALFGSLATCQDNASSFFCTGSGFGCHYLHLHKGECKSDNYLEGCRIYKPLTNASECWKEENDRMKGTEGWESGEIYSPDSRCFFSTLSRNNGSHSPSSHQPVVGRCYRHNCTGPNLYQVKVDNSEWTDCPAGSSIQVVGYTGSLFCPDKKLCHREHTAPKANQLGTPFFSVSSMGSYGAEKQEHHVDMTSDSDHALIPLTTIAVLALFVIGSCLVYRSYRSSRVRVHSIT